MSATNTAPDAVMLRVTLKHRTARAVLCDDGTQTFWIPISQILHASALGDRRADLVVPQWLFERIELDGNTGGGESRASRDQTEPAAKLYRRLAAKHHPDAGGNSEFMKDLNELWQAVRRERRS